MADETVSPAYAKEVGLRLRDIRRQQGLSLQAVAEASEREFKASVLGAYERGERMISVLRLQRLAELYGVPVDQLLPRVPTTGRGVHGSGEGSPSRRVKIDLVRLETTQFPERDLLKRYIGMIQLERGDYNGKMITIRAEDLRSLARMLETDEEALQERLDELGIRM
ncbi:MAG: transcriptional regulator [Acidimicrobiaceae bacterium]|nr:transcriptional regulator [Acidimicrobiaceae bacterium]